MLHEYSFARSLLDLDVLILMLTKVLQDSARYFREYIVFFLFAALESHQMIPRKLRDTRVSSHISRTGEHES